MRWISRIVTFVVIAAFIFGAAALVRSKMPATHLGGHFYTYARFRDGARLATGSPVMIAGVRVGEIYRLTIEGTFARVDLELVDTTDIPIDSWITKKAESAFGDSYLEIIPGGNGEGAAPRRLKSGEPIIHVLEGGSTDTALRSVARTLPKVDRGLDTVHDFALAGRKWASGRLEDALIGADRWLVEGHIVKPIESADRAMVRLEDGTTRAADAIASAKPDVNRWFDRIDNGIASARRQMADIRTGLHDGLANARDGIDKVDPTLQQLGDVVAAVNEGRGDDGKGRLGRLINDTEVGEQLDDLSEAGKDAVVSLDPFKSWFGVRAEWNVFSGVPKFYVGAELRGHNDKFYLIEFSKSGQGGVPEDQLTDVLSAQQFNRFQEIKEAVRFTLEFGKRFGPLQLRAGIKESTFGVGSDLLLGSGRLRFSADAFGGFSHIPRVKLAGAIEVFRSVYISGGVDDVFTTPGYIPIETGNSAEPTYFNKLRYGRDYFLGGELRFTDEDLGSMVRIYGAMLAALLIGT
ncbi:MAG TPA: MlaD family protein [Kofleriaceae bacterium]|nr:MlaD family protein [Kofleriaceae bacterium]